MVNKKSNERRLKNTKKQKFKNYFLQLSRKVSLSIFHPKLKEDIINSIKFGIRNRAVINFNGVKSLFVKSVYSAINSVGNRIENLIRFLLLGPYENKGKIPKILIGKRIDDKETMQTINYIYCRVINAFQGVLMELLAIRPIMELHIKLKKKGLLSKKSRVYLFDSVLVKGKRGGWKKGADVHWLSIENEIVSLDGVCEVKSYLPSSEKLDNQINKHIIRFRRGCLINGKSYGEAFVKKQQTVKISVIPAKWKLSRKFEFEKRGEKNYFIPDEKLPDLPSEIISQIKTFNYQIIIPWSYEALAAEAYKLTLWLMYELGKIAYDKGVPNEWKEMTPGKAGQNAAELMLYYAIGRCNTGSKSEQRAIALYNTYGFGYSIGMNFLDSKGKRKMLWYKDLQEIKQNGKTMDGFSIKI